MMPQSALLLVAFLILSTTSGWPQATASDQATPPVSESEPIICDTRSATLGRPLTEVAPEYPKRALRAKIQGDVILDLTVSENGKVVSVSVLSGNPQLAREATKAVRKWEYFPNSESNNAERHTRVTLVFKIDDHGNSVIGSEFPPPPTFCNEAQGVTFPRAIYAPDPPYTEEARKAKLSGVCVLSLIVGRDGLPRDVQLTRALGSGLDEKATEAVRQWKFDPARRNGVPVAVKIHVEVMFRLF